MRIFLLFVLVAVVPRLVVAESIVGFSERWLRSYDASLPAQSASDDVGRKIAKAAAERIGKTRFYDPSYQGLNYPGGDVASDRGVCSDVLIRALRSVGVDLQVHLYRDRKRSLTSYPRIWANHVVDRSIDHRRVANLMHYLSRVSTSLPLKPEAFEPGDAVVWLLDSNLLHVGVVGTERVPGTQRYYVVHNIGQGTQREDVLRDWKMLAGFRLNAFVARYTTNGGSKK